LESLSMDFCIKALVVLDRGVRDEGCW
jgi:hypothetical protein